MAERVLWVVVRDYYAEGVNGEIRTDEHCVLFGTKPEAEEMMGKLNAGCDPSFFPVQMEEPGFLFVDRRTV